MEVVPRCRFQEERACVHEHTVPNEKKRRGRGKCEIENSPPSNNLSNICLSTCLDPSRSDTRLWYFPSPAVLSEPIASAAPLTETGTAARTGAGWYCSAETGES